MKEAKRVMALSLAAMMSLGLLASCGSGSTSDSTGSGSADASTDTTGTKVLTLGMDSEPVSLDPDDATGKGATFVDKAVYEPLWRMDNEGNTYFMLATDYEWTGDLELTIHLREGVTYHNGDVFNADDFFYSLDLLLASTSRAQRFSCIDRDASYAEDDYTVVLELNEWNPILIDNMGGNGLFMYDAEWGGDLTAEMNGTGAYELADWTQGVGITLTRNENYWGDAGYYDELDVRFYTDETTRMLAFENGDIDIIYITTDENISRVANGELDDAVLYSFTVEHVEGLAFDSVDFPQLADINVRKAIAHAINVPEMVSAICGNTAVPATSVLGSSDWAYLNTGYYEYDPEYAKECLEAAGYNDTDNRLSLVYRVADRGTNSDFGEAIQAYLAEIGIDMEVSVGEAAAVMNEQINNEIMFGSAGGIGSGDPAGMLDSHMPPHTNNFGLWTEELDDLLVQAQASRDQDERVTLYQEIQQEVHDQYLFIPLTEATENYVAREGIVGVEESQDAECYLGWFNLAEG